MISEKQEKLWAFATALAKELRERTRERWEPALYEQYDHWCDIVSPQGKKLSLSCRSKSERVDIQGWYPSAPQWELVDMFERKLCVRRPEVSVGIDRDAAQVGKMLVMRFLPTYTVLFDACTMKKAEHDERHRLMDELAKRMATLTGERYAVEFLVNRYGDGISFGLKVQNPDEIELKLEKLTEEQAVAVFRLLGLAVYGNSLTQKQGDTNVSRQQCGVQHNDSCGEHDVFLECEGSKKREEVPLHLRESK